MIKFIEEEESQPELAFIDVELDQFFESTEGYLCHKFDESAYNILTDEKGRPLADRVNNANSNIKINRILPKITKIEF